METNFFSSFVEDTKTLAKTIVVKSDISRDFINKKLILQYGAAAVEMNDPSSWKYHMNLAGLYHPTDTMMTITSLDTLETIDFTKDNLVSHTATARAYRYGSRYYQSLLERFPEQEQLMLGILYPADLDTVVDSDHGTILAYPDYLVEPQEVSLMSELQAWITRWFRRWHVALFVNVDGLYAAEMYARFFSDLYIKLFNLRFKRCKTNEAHSFHVREYLASHFGLDSYLAYMTDKQRMWLYRNIRYIARNAGKVEQFQTLVEHLLTERRIPLNEYSVRQLAEFDEIFKPEIIARRKPINGDFNVPANPQFSFAELLQNEAPLVYGNPEEIEQDAEKMALQFKNSLSSVTQTKIVESKMVDYSDSVPEPLMSVLFRLWIQASNQGLYNVNITFKDPKTTLEHNLFARDALIYYTYITANAYGVWQGAIPNLFNLRQWRIPKATAADLLAVVDYKTFPDLADIALLLVNHMPKLKQMTSVSSFFELGYSLYDHALYEWYMTSSVGDMDRRGYVENMTHMQHSAQEYEMDIGMPINQWLGERDLPVYDYTVQEAEALMLSVFQAAVGWSVDKTKQLKYIQQAMIEVLRKLSSYSIQFIYDINDSAIVPINWDNVRLGGLKDTITGSLDIPIPEQVLEIIGHVTDLRDVVREGGPRLLAVGEINAALIEIDIGNEIVMEAKLKDSVELRTSFNLFESPELSNLDQLTTEELFKIKTISP